LDAPQKVRQLLTVSGLGKLFIGACKQSFPSLINLSTLPGGEAIYLYSDRCELGWRVLAETGAKERVEAREFEVIISGKIKGFNIATAEEVAELREELSKQKEEIERLIKDLKEQAGQINAINTRLDRIEAFLRSFK